MGNPSAKGTRGYRPGDLLTGLGMEKGAAGIFSGDIAAEPVVEKLDDIVFDVSKKEREAAAAERERSATTRSSMEGYWGNYQTWASDAKTGFERRQSGMRARMAAGGIKEGSEQWETNIARIQSEYDVELAGLKKGVTGSAMESWAAKNQAGSEKPLGMEDYMGKEFGVRKAPVSKAESTASPWW